MPFWGTSAPCKVEAGGVEESFPFPAFPPYPRGLVRAMSMDVVRGLAAVGDAGRLRMIFGDDPCLGVHLRQLLYDETEPASIIQLDDRI